MASEPRELQKLKSLLKELFQLDAEDLDFGMYRVLRLRRDELTTFLERTLADEVRRALGSADERERADVLARLREMERQAAEWGGSPEKNPDYVKLKAMMASAEDGTARERQVYAHLGEFFSRYYEDGDFVSLPRLGRDTYAVPYDGSEVVLHWANKDQYYVKSGEYFARYAFQLRDGRRVVFRLVDAETDPDNVKGTDAGKRRFRLADGEDVVEVVDGELVCRFVYQPAEGKQEAVNEATEGRILGASPGDWRHALSAPKGERTLLGWNLRQYTEKNKRDYFIHKDLGGFLRRELDHYLKTEVFDLDAVESMADDDVARALGMVKTVRAVARPVIDFLASIEDFQKRLFLKKKAVLRTEWCVTLDRVPEGMYAEIGANEAQVRRWKDLFAIDEVDVPPLIPGGDARGATVTAEFLKRNRGLVVETRFFDRVFTARLLAALGKGVDEGVTGVMLRTEASPALRLLGPRFGGYIDVLATDPPYNTGRDDFSYKDRYQHSSWLTMLHERLSLARGLLSDHGSAFIMIDDGEQRRLAMMSSGVFGDASYVADVIWEKKYARQNDAHWFSMSHDHILVLAKDGPRWCPRTVRRTAAQTAAYTNPDGDPNGPWQSVVYTCNKTAEERPNLYYPIKHPKTEEPIWPERNRVWAFDPVSHARNEAEGRLDWGRDQRKSKPRQKVYLRDLGGGVVPTSLWPRSEVGDNQDSVREVTSLFGSVVFPTPKPVGLMSRIVEIGLWDGIILDAFAGSGTTGHAVLNLNREDQGGRTFILVEVNDYFDTVLVPRILKASYSKDWKEGKPVDRTPVPGGALYKVLYLESYEDSLANVTLPARRDDNVLPMRFHREYTVRYMLDHETRVAVLDLDRFRKPFSWTMEVRRGGMVTPEHPVDLVETFNYLIGLRVSRYGFFGDPDRLRYVEGTVIEDGDERRVLVLWRDCDAVPDEEVLRLFDDREFAPVSSREYDRIYVNGDPPLANARRDGEHWKVLAIEDEFKRLSFADDDGT